MTERFEIHLVGGADPDGSIDLGLFAPLAAALSDLNGRVVRWQAGRGGAGRPTAEIEAMAKCRLLGVTAGSTRLEIVRGAPETLDLGDEAEADLDSAFWAILSDLASGRPASDVPEGVRESALKLVDAVGRAAPLAVFQSSSRAEHSVRLIASDVQRDAWALGATVRVAPEQVVAGVLESANLRTAQFSIRDDAGNRIRLGHVGHLDEVRHLLGERVVAVGRLRQIGTDWVMDRPERLSLEPGLNLPMLPSLEGELRKRGPQAADDDLLDDEQFAAFLAAARGG